MDIQNSCTTGFEDLPIQTIVGVYPAEQVHPQKLLVSLALQYSSKDCVAFLETDDLADAMDYQKAADFIILFCAEHQFGLLEHLCASLASELMSLFPQCCALRLKITKTQAVPGSAGSFCSWCCERNSGTL